MKKYLFLVLIFALLIGRCADEPEEQAESSVPVKLTRVQKKVFAQPVHSNGIVSSEKQIKLSFKIGGLLARIYVEQGDYVKKGERLASLNLKEIKAQVEQAESGLEKAERDYLRAKNLYADSVTTLEQVQNAETALKVAQAQLDAAEFNLNHAQITAPADGQILHVLLEEGEMVAQGHPVLVFGSAGDYWKVDANVTSKDVIRLHIGDSAQVRFDELKKTFSGQIHAIAGGAHPRTGTFNIEIALDETSAGIKNGLIARILFTPSEKDTFHVVPFRSLVGVDGPHGHVFTVTGEKLAQQHPVRVAFITGEDAAISDGLQHVKNVIADGAAYLSDGQPVKIVE